MPKLQRLPDGHHVITVPKHLVEAKVWKPGEVISFIIVDETNRPLQGDIFLRKTG